MVLAQSWLRLTTLVQAVGSNFQIIGCLIVSPTVQYHLPMSVNVHHLALAGAPRQNFAFVGWVLIGRSGKHQEDVQ